MAVPNIFGTATSAIPLSQLDTNFATPVTIGNTAVQLGNTVTSFGNVTLTNVTISSGNVTVSAGSNTSPSITTVGDTNTGIFFPAADTIAFSEGGVEAVRIDSSGNVGIGTASPATKLHVKSGNSNQLTIDNAGEQFTSLFLANNGTTKANLYYDNTNSTYQLYATAASSQLLFGTVNTERMRITSAGDVGIGTSSPGTKLDVQGTVAGNFFQNLYNDSSNASAQTLYVAKSFGASGIQFGQQKSTANGIINVIDSAALTFGTGNTERARIDSSGNLGIGLTPTASVGALQVTGGIFATSTQYVGAAGSTAFSGGIQNLSNTSKSVSIEADPTNAGANSLIIFNIDATERFRINSNGVLTSLATYNNVSGGSPNMFIQTDGTIYRGTSALKYKQDVRDLELIDINKFRAVRYKSKCELDDQTIDYFGVIADEVDAAGIKELVSYGADGEVENFQYDRFTVVLLKAVQEQQALIQSLTTRITALEQA
jgi:hypothetical protein